MNWKRPSKCGHCECVEVAFDGERVKVRDSKLGDNSPVLTFTLAEWRQELDVIRRTAMPYRCVLQLPEGVWDWRHDGVKLVFTDAEMEKFAEGVDAGEFDLPEPSHVS